MPRWPKKNRQAKLSRSQGDHGSNVSDGSAMDWRELAKWSSDRLSITCTLCSKVLSAPKRKVFSFQRHVKLVHSDFNPTECQPENQAKAKAANVKNLKNRWQKRASNRVHPGSLKTGMRLRSRRLTEYARTVARQTGKRQSSLKQPCELEIEAVEEHSVSSLDSSKCNVGQAEARESKSSLMNEGSYLRHFISDGTVRDCEPTSATDVQGQVKQFATCVLELKYSDPARFTDEDLAAICSINWQIHGQRSSDRKMVICKWCEAQYPLEGENLLGNFLGHLSKHHSIEYLAGRSISDVLEANLALSRIYVICNVCHSAIFTKIADFDSHLKDHHQVHPQRS
uniref:C2H2-type domain-containing protein n=1 Tax=Trichuris muris TaxID=70415 RepID=A0A5S6QMS1_TRIMR